MVVKGSDPSTASRLVRPQSSAQTTNVGTAAPAPSSATPAQVARTTDTFGEPGTRGRAVIGTEPTSSTTLPQRGGLKAHALRANPEVAGSAWHQKASLPSVPPGALRGGGQVVVVDGERFSPADIAQLLAFAA